MSTRGNWVKAGRNRRGFMRDAGATAAGIAVAAAGAETLLAGKAEATTERVPLAEMNPKSLVEARAVQGDLLAGSVVSAGAGGLVVRPPASAPVTVSLTSNAHVSRSGDASLSAFAAGEEVVLLGERRGNRFTAVSVTEVLRTKAATVYSRSGRRVQTSEGEVVITPETGAQGGIAPSGSSCSSEPFQAVPLKDLKPGDEIVAIGHLNRQSGAMRASVIGTRPASDDDPLALP